MWFLFCRVRQIVHWKISQIFRYYTRQDALEAVNIISGTKLDDRVVRCEVDPGFVEGRQYGKGKTGGQVNLKFIFT